MELIVAVALLAIFGAWWIVRAKAGRNNEQVAHQQTKLEDSPTSPTLPTSLPLESLSPHQFTAEAKPKRDRPFAEIADPNGGVREISSDEVSAYFRPVRTSLPVCVRSPPISTGLLWRLHKAMALPPM
jgi:hypothetical protein